MPAGFPPSPIFPTGIDSDYQLYSWHNTTQSVITQDNEPWAEEIPVKPVPLGKDEIWATNGFATISGELLYYDATGTTTDGRINLLKRCARNLGGSPTQFNPINTDIQANVTAEHHNQLAQCLFNIQDFVGVNFDTRLETLDYRIRHLEETPVIWDDFSCPDVTLFFDTVSTDPAKGTVVQYNAQITGTYNSFRIDFGDGESTTSTQSGTHTYAPNSTIDPVVTVGNDKCTVTQTDIERTTQVEPTPGTSPPPFTIPLPEFPAPPPFLFPTIPVNNPTVQFPPIVFPCIDISPFPGISIGPIYINVPSLISFSPINIPSFISISPINIPSLISITPIDIPSIITFGPTPVISPIGFGPTPSIAPIDINITVTIDGSGIPSCISIGNCGGPSGLAIDWGKAPTLNVAFTHQLNSQSARKYSKEDLELMKDLGDDYRDFFPDAEQNFGIEYQGLGIPSEIAIVAPKFPDIKLRHDLPQEIKLTKGDFDLPSTIQILGPTNTIPTEIHIVNNSLPGVIELLSDVPSIIKVEHNIPNRIVIETLNEIPSVIRIEHTIPDQIKVTGVPDSIELVFPQETIRLTVDENLEIPLVYKGAPIELKIDMPKFFVTDEDDDDYPRVKIVPAPCPKR